MPSSSARLAGLERLPDELWANADAPTKSNVKQAETNFMIGSELAGIGFNTGREGRPPLHSILEKCISQALFLPVVLFTPLSNPGPGRRSNRDFSAPRVLLGGRNERESLGIDKDPPPSLYFDGYLITQLSN